MPVIALSELGPLIAALASLLVVLGNKILVKFLKAIWDNVTSKSFWEILALGPFNLFWQHHVTPQALSGVEPFPREIHGHAKAFGAYISSNFNAHQTAQQKLAILRQETTTLHANVHWLSTAATKPSSVASVATHLDSVAHNLDRLREEVTHLSTYLNGPYRHGIVKDINAAQGKAEAHAKAAAVSLVESQDEIFRRRVRALEGARGISIPWATDTIPIALAGIAAAVVPLTIEAAECVTPMCSDWNLAKDALEAALAGLTTAGAITFLVDAVTNPESFGKSVADSAGVWGDRAVDVFYDTLGLTRPPLTE